MHLLKCRDDPELDRMLKDRLRWGDPMAHLVKVYGDLHVEFFRNFLKTKTFLNIFVYYSFFSNNDFQYLKTSF